MADFNQVLTPGDYQNGVVNTVVEIPQGSFLKIEWDRGRAAFMLDRVEPSIYAKPVNYGFIPQTLDEDGDELDTLIVCADYKIVVVPADDRNTGDSIHHLRDLGGRWQQMITEHFTHYKDLKKPGTTDVQGWGDVEEAKKIVAESIERWNNQK
jgi:inorganic pyrophosphatase